MKTWKFTMICFRFRHFTPLRKRCKQNNDTHCKQKQLHVVQLHSKPNHYHRFKSYSVSSRGRTLIVWVVTVGVCRINSACILPQSVCADGAKGTERMENFKLCLKIKKAFLDAIHTKHTQNYQWLSGESGRVYSPGGPVPVFVYTAL